MIRYCLILFEGDCLPEATTKKHQQVRHSGQAQRDPESISVTGKMDAASSAA